VIRTLHHQAQALSCRSTTRHSRAVPRTVSSYPYPGFILTYRRITRSCGPYVCESHPPVYCSPSAARLLWLLPLLFLCSFFSKCNGVGYLHPDPVAAVSASWGTVCFCCMLPCSPAPLLLCSPAPSCTRWVGAPARQVGRAALGDLMFSKVGEGERGDAHPALAEKSRLLVGRARDQSIRRAGVQNGLVYW